MHLRLNTDQLLSRLFVHAHAFPEPLAVEYESPSTINAGLGAAEVYNRGAWGRAAARGYFEPSRYWGAPWQRFIPTGSSAICQPQEH